VDALKYIAVVLYVTVFCAWAIVAGRTLTTKVRGRASDAQLPQEALAARASSDATYLLEQV
jgi:hypothetical protein